MPSIDKLKLAKFIYDLKKKEFLRSADNLDDIEFIEGVEMLMRDLGENYHGALTDFQLEKVISKRFELHKQQSEPNEIKRVMHVATFLYSTGGHTKIIKDWLADDSSSVGLVVTRQTTEEIESLELIELEERNYVGLGSLSYEQKVEEISRLCKEWECDLIVIHHHFYDVVPFLVRSRLPNVSMAVYNHADHIPWVGSTLTDLVIEFRDCGARASLNRRGASRVEVLAFQFEASRVNTPKPKDSVKLVSMGSAYKYVPKEEHNLLELYAEFLFEHPEIEMTIVGVDKEFFNKHSKHSCPDNLILPGIVVDPSQYLKEAHYFIEPFPIGSGLACLDGAREGAVPIIAFGHIHNIHGIGINSILPELDYGSNSWSKEGYVKFIEQEFKSMDYRKRALLKLKDCEKRMSKESWKKNLARIYSTFNERHLQNSVARVSRKPTLYDLRWHEFISKSLVENFRSAVLGSSQIGLRDFVRIVRYAVKLRRSEGLYFPNNDIKEMFKRVSIK